MSFVNEKLNKFNEDVKGKKIAIIGLGVSNMPLIDYFNELNCDITAFDNRVEEKIDKDIIEKLNSLNIKYYVGDDCLNNLVGFDYIFRSPSARPDKPEFLAEIERGAVLTTEIEQVLELSPSHIIGITGSDGKTTTTSMIYQILKNAGKKCFLGGNIGTPLFTEIKDMMPDDYVVLELSSFQLMNMKKSPEIAVITNITPNHLDIHKDYQEYIDAKKTIFINQDENGILVTNKDNELTKDLDKEAKGETRFFAHKQILDNGIIFDESDQNIKLMEDGKETILINRFDMSVRGEHNCENACTALLATYGLVPLESAVETIRKFSGVEHRLEFVREINGVKWYNDSIGTSPTRTIAGLNSYVEKIVLIAGGYDKHLEYEPIAKPIVDNVSKLILIGATADKIEKAVKDELAKENKPEDYIPMYRCNTLQEVCEKAKKVAVEGEVVLFSPASASFDMFKNFMERGELFKNIVNGL